MLKRMLSFILLFICLNCKNYNENNLSDMLNGDWKNNFIVHTPYGRENHELSFTFLDTICSNYSNGRYANFIIKDSILTIKHKFYRYKRGGEIYQYKLDNINKKSFQVTPLSINAKKTFCNQSRKFTKVNTINNYRFKHIGF